MLLLFLLLLLWLFLPHGSVSAVFKCWFALTGLFCLEKSLQLILLRIESSVSRLHDNLNFKTTVRAVAGAVINIESLSMRNDGPQSFDSRNFVNQIDSVALGRVTGELRPRWVVFPVGILA